MPTALKNVFSPSLTAVGEGGGGGGLPTVVKKAFMFWGGWAGVDPRQTAEDIFAPLLEAAGYEVRVEDYLDPLLDRDYLESLDLIVPVWTQGVLTRDQERNLLDAVAGGVGIGGWHGGMGDAFRTNV